MDDELGAPPGTDVPNVEYYVGISIHTRLFWCYTSSQIVKKHFNEYSPFTGDVPLWRVNEPPPRMSARPLGKGSPMSQVKFPAPDAP